MRLLPLLLVLPLAGCFGPAEATHEGPCTPGDILLSYSGMANMPDDRRAPPEWTVIWPSGDVWVVTVESESTFGDFEKSSVTAVEPLDPATACGIVAFHGTYPGGGTPAWEELGLQERVYEYRVVRTATGNADPAPIVALMDDFARLREDSSVPGCADGVSLRYTGQHDGEVVSRRASCEWSEDFQAFHDAVQRWLGNR